MFFLVFGFTIRALYPSRLNELMAKVLSGVSKEAVDGAASSSSSSSAGESEATKTSA